jgi:hypothetical protein
LLLLQLLLGQASFLFPQQLSEIAIKRHTRFGSILMRLGAQSHWNDRVPRIAQRGESVTTPAEIH